MGAVPISSTSRKSKMNTDVFRKTLTGDSPPDGLDDCLLALWFDGRGDWEAAHNVAQKVKSRDGAWVHGYLHRVEGDLGNARYWYDRAGRPFTDVPLKDEWAAIAEELLADARP